MRVVSVLPSATEIVCAVGAGPELVGRSEECDFPPMVRALPVVMRARTLDGGAPSIDIDARVTQALAATTSLYQLDVEVLAALSPDLLLTQDLCRVCSVTDDEVVAACRAAGVTPTILSLAPTRADEVWASVATVAQAVGHPRDGAALAESLRRRVPERTARATDPTVLVLEWIDPPIESGLWTPDLVRSAGGRSWSAVPGGEAVRLDWAAVERTPPDLLVVSPCAFSVDRSIRELSTSAVGARLARLGCARGVWVADEAYFSRPGPRLAEGRELISDLLTGAASPDLPGVRSWTRAPPVGAA